MDLINGQRVMTVLGPGTVIGFEVFLLNGRSAPIANSPTWDCSRVVVKLDDSSKWPGTPGTPNPFFYRSGLSELKE